tara:strand:+ start:1342 stop:1647 length:306 start_codon:yes stop_codon:yes gene_type:complete
MKNNNEMYSFFSKFIILILLIVVLLSLTGAIYADKKKQVEPLSIEQQQQIVMQIGISGYKRMIKINCYESLVIRIRTERWDDQYCASSYNHLDFDKIRGNK